MCVCVWEAGPATRKGCLTPAERSLSSCGDACVFTAVGAVGLEVVGDSVSGTVCPLAGRAGRCWGCCRGPVL